MFKSFFGIIFGITLSMRKQFENQLALGTTPINEVEIPSKTRSHIVALVAALQHIYVSPKWNTKIFSLLSEKVMKNKQSTGREGMSLWEMFVLAQVRLSDDSSYDELHHKANYDTLIRGILGVLPTDYSLGKQYSYQNIYDNVSLIDDELLIKINGLIIEVGHEVFKKKENTPLRLKTDSFVCETDTHFPTDYNLLWDSARKCIDTVNHLRKEIEISGWRKHAHWKKSIKSSMRKVGKVSSGGGQNKEVRVKQEVKRYLEQAEKLSNKVEAILKAPLSLDSPKALALVQSLNYYQSMLIKHIDLVDRRLLKAEVIPHEEKVFSIFQDYTEFIKKGKLRPNVEIGKKVAITTDQFDLIVDHQIADHQTDSQMTRAIINRIYSKHSIQSLSVDKGYSNKEDRLWLEGFIPEVIMPKKGKRNKAETEKEHQPKYRKLKKKHSAIESNINELEHRGLGRCPDRSWQKFKNYTALAVCAYNLHKIGRKLLKDRVAQEQKEKEKRLSIAA